MALCHGTWDHSLIFPIDVSGPCIIPYAATTNRLVVSCFKLSTTSFLWFAKLPVFSTLIRNALPDNVASVSHISSTQSGINWKFFCSCDGSVVSTLVDLALVLVTQETTKNHCLTNWKYIDSAKFPRLLTVVLKISQQTTNTLMRHNQFFKIRKAQPVTDSNSESQRNDRSITALPFQSQYQSKAHTISETKRLLTCEKNGSKTDRFSNLYAITAKSQMLNISL